MTLTLDHRTKVLIAAVLMIAIAAGGWLVGVQPAFGSAFAAFAQEADVRVQNDGLRTRLTQLADAEKDLPNLKDHLAKLTASVPGTISTSALLSDLNGIAASSGAVVDRVTVDAGTPYAAPGTAAASAAGTTASSGAAAAAAVDPSVVPFSDPRITAKNFVVVPVSVDVTGSLDAALAFVHGVQSGSRLFLVNRIASVTDAQNGGDTGTVKATVAGYVYVLQDGKKAPATQG